MSNPPPTPASIYVTNLIPPPLIPALEIDSPANLIALYWEPAGDEATWYDGRTGADCNWWAYQTYFDHPAIITALAQLRLDRYCLGSSDTPATHWAIIDRAQSHLYIAPRQDAERIIRAQWPQPDPAELIRTQELLAHIDWTQFRRQLAAVLADTPTPTPAQLQKRLAEREHNCRQLQTWLDQHQRRRILTDDDLAAWFYMTDLPNTEAEP